MSNISLTAHWQMLTAWLCVLVLLIFLIRAYRGHWAILLWLGGGLACTLWPGILTYPSQRYLNLMYPFLIFILVYGIYAAHKYVDSFIMRLLSLVILAGMMLMVVSGIYSNYYGLGSAARGCMVYKQRYDDFFTQHTFAPTANFVIVSTPFVSDIQSIFQAFLNNRTTRVVCDPFMTLAQRGIMGCRKDYRIVGVPSEIVAIPNGFRLMSHDPEHCGWWLRFSDFPIAWSSQSGAYAWTSEPYREGVTYPCSLGKFTIHKQIDADCVADISFIIDRRWVDSNTIFVVWDTMAGRYKVL
jgi:hypothetical protein